jgi:hypothetical protein
MRSVVEQTVSRLGPHDVMHSNVGVGRTCGVLDPIGPKS